MYVYILALEKEKFQIIKILLYQIHTTQYKSSPSKFPIPPETTDIFLIPLKTILETLFLSLVDFQVTFLTALTLPLMYQRKPFRKTQFY